MNREQQRAIVRANVIAGVPMAGGSATVPITNGDMAAGALSFAPIGAEAPPVGATVGATSAAPAASSARNDHNTALHLGGFLLACGLFIAWWHGGGFRMAYDVSLGR